MFDSQVLDVFIGLIFIFLLVSIICTAVREGIEGWLKTRAAYLEYGIRGLLSDINGEGLTEKLYNHPLVFCLFSGDYVQPADARKSVGGSAAATAKPGILAKGNELPSYIPASNFAFALLDLAANGPVAAASAGNDHQPVTLESVRTNIRSNIANPLVQRVVLSAIDAAQGDLDKALHNIEVWYDSSMDRVSGWYRRSTQWIIFWVSLFVAVALNINAITIADYLYTNDTARGVVLSQAEHAATEPDFARKSYADVKNQLHGLGLPIGWDEGWGAPRRGAELPHDGILIWNDVAAPVLGWLFTALAAMLGAPFWFDVLNRVMVIRSTVKPREKSPEEGPQDRPPAIPTVAVVGSTDASRFVGGAMQPLPFMAVIQPVADMTENHLDGCGCGIDQTATSITTDDQLPAAQGGVA